MHYTSSIMKGKLLLLYITTVSMVLLLTLTLIQLVGFSGIKTHTLDLLAALSRSKAHQVQSLLEQDLERVQLIASRTQMRLSLRDFQQHGADGAELQKRLRTILADASSSVESILEVALTDRQGKVVVLLGDHSLTTNSVPDSWYTTPIKGPYFGPFEWQDAKRGQYTLALPLTLPGEKEDFLGAVIARLSLKRMGEILNDQTGLGPTGVIDLLSSPQNELLSPPRPQLFPNHDKFEASSPVLFYDFSWVVRTRQSSHEVMTAFSSLNMYTLGGGLVLFVLGSLVILLGIGKSLAPIHTLTLGAQILGQGNLSHRIPEDRTDELGHLAKAFNLMATQLQKSNHRIQSLLEHIPSGMVAIDQVNQGICYTNSALCDLLGYTLEELMGLTFQEIFTTIYEAPKTTKQPVTVELEGLCKDGRLLTIEAVQSPFELDGQNHTLWVMNDVTQHKKLQHQFFEAQKLNAVGQLAAGMAHDLNNQMAGIQGYCDLLELMPLPEEAQKMVQNIFGCVQRSVKLTTQLLTFSRQGKYDLKEVSIHTLITGVIELLQSTRDKKIRFTPQFQATNDRVLADDNQIQNALLNLGINACDAMAEGGVLTFASANCNLKDSAPEVLEGMTPGEYLCLTVSDTGSGIASQNLARIFEPFFTTKDKSRGSGLGLASTYGSILGHKGNIKVSSEVNVGTVFRIYLPVVSTPATPLTIPEPPKASLLLPYNILVVDDEVTVIKIVQQYLSLKGCTVKTFTSGAEALQDFELDPAWADLVLQDVMMPGLSGSEIYEKMVSLRPNIPVLVMSGYSQEQVTQGLFAKGAQGFVSKPFNLRELTQKIAEIIESQ